MLERASQSGFSSGNRRYRLVDGVPGHAARGDLARRPRPYMKQPGHLHFGHLDARVSVCQPTRSAPFAFSDDSRVIISDSAHCSAGARAPCRPSGLTVGQNILFSSGWAGFGVGEAKPIPRQFPPAAGWKTQMLAGSPRSCNCSEQRPDTCGHRENMHPVTYSEANPPARRERKLRDFLIHACHCTSRPGILFALPRNPQ